MRKRLVVAICLIAGPLFITVAAGAFQEQSQKHALIYVIDGIPTLEFEEMLANGELPNFRKHIYERGIYSKNHVTVYPSLTFPAMVSVFSGCYPSTLGVPNFFWVDRDRGVYENFFSIQFDEYRHYENQDVRMLLDYFPHERTLCFGLPVYPGRAAFERELEGSFIDRFREARDLDYISKAIERKHSIGLDMFVKPAKFLSLFNPAKDTNVISLLNPASRRGILRHTIGSFSESTREIRRRRPDVVIYYQWETDHEGHEDGTYSPEVHESLIEADTQFGRIVRAYEKAGIYDDTYFLLVSDHSQIPIEAHYVNIVRMFADKGFKAKLISHELIAHEGVRSLLHVGSLLISSGSIARYNCLLGTSGDDLVSVYLSKDGGTSLNSWKKEVHYNDILQYGAAANTYVNVEDFISSIEGVDFFLIREKEFLPGEPHVTRIASRCGSALVTAILDGTKPVRLKYQVINGVDPLEYSQCPALAEMIAAGYHDDRDWLCATAAAHYPDALVQIAQLMELDRAGSIIIQPDHTHSFNAYSWSKHGGLTADQMKSVFAISGPGISPGVIEYSRTVDIVPTFLRLMGKKAVSSPMDGIVLREIVGNQEPPQISSSSLR